MSPLSAALRDALRAGCLIAALACAGCATMAGTILASQDEYLAYRKVRVSTELTERLAHSSRYLRSYPKGRWADEVRPWFERAEFRYYLNQQETPEGLTAYLAALPDGPHADDARRALEEHNKQQREARKELLGIQAALTEARLAQLQHQRDRALGAFVEWLGRLLAIETWGQRTSALDHEFLFAWRIAPPGARCVDDRCSRVVERAYLLPGGGEAARRELVMEVVLLLHNGMVVGARLEGPALFSRLYEASTNQPVTPERLLARVFAIARAVDVVQGAAEARMPAASCAQQVVAPVVLLRSCGGWSIRAIAAEHPGEDDAVEITGPTDEPW